MGVTFLGHWLETVVLCEAQVLKDLSQQGKPLKSIANKTYCKF